MVIREFTEKTFRIQISIFKPFVIRKEIKKKKKNTARKKNSLNLNKRKEIIADKHGR